MQAKKTFLEKQATKLNSADSTKFWNQFRRTCYQKTNNSIGTIINNGNAVISDATKAEIFHEDIFTGKHLINCNYDTNWRRKVEDLIKTAENSNEGPSNEKPTDLNKDIEIKEIENAINRT